MAKKVMIIDDDKDFRDAVKTLLRAKGYDITEAQDGKSGLEKALEVIPDLIILDVMMAHATEGYEVARSFRDNPKTKDIPVIMVTGVKKAMDLGFDISADYWLPVKAVIEKPVQPEKLLKILEENLG